MYIKINGEWYSPALGHRIQVFLTEGGKDAVHAVLEATAELPFVSFGLFPDNDKLTPVQRSQFLTKPPGYEDVEETSIDQIKH